MTKEAEEIKYTMKGGIMPLSREIVVNGNNYSISDKGEVVKVGILEPEIVKNLTVLLEDLIRIQPKSRYGAWRYISDPSYERLITGTLNIHVQSDPSDPPPGEFLEFRSKLLRIVNT